MHESEIELDRKIDAALATYSDPAESLNSSALAARVLATAREKQQGIQWWRWGLVAAVPALAALLILLYLPAKPKIEPVRLSMAAPPVVQQPVISPMPEKLPVSHTEVRTSHASHVAAPSQEPPKLDVFPTPRPLSEQEKLMVAFVQSAPQEAQKQAAQDSEPIQPITIADLTIPPLDPPAKDGAKTGDHK
jgi:hypothetical protein